MTDHLLGERVLAPYIQLKPLRYAFFCTTVAVLRHPTSELINIESMNGNPLGCRKDNQLTEFFHRMTFQI